MIARRGRRLCACVLAVSLASVLMVGCAARSPHLIVDLSALNQRVGVYAFGAESDTTAARASGIDFAIAEPGSGIPRPLLSLDPGPKSLLYTAACPSGPASCSVLSALERGRLLDAIRTRALQDAHDPSVLGIYLTDDYWADFSDLLPYVYAAIRETGFSKPVVCGVGASLSLRSDRASTTPDRSLELSLRNYSAAWCNAVMLYIYTPSGRGPSSTAYDWTMSKPLRQAMAGLRAKGFQMGRDLLIGTPQAFQYYPATKRDHSDQRYWVGPSAAELTTQIAAFCGAGARSIVGYTWDDGRIGVVTELGNSPALRAAFLNGVQTCRLNYW